MTPKRIIGIVILLIGVYLFHQGSDLKEEAADTVNTVVAEPLNALASGNMNFDIDKYYKESTTKSIHLGMDLDSYEIKFAEGTTAIVLGLGLMLFGGTRRDDEDFWSAAFRFFK